MAISPAMASDMMGGSALSSATAISSASAGKGLMVFFGGSKTSWIPLLGLALIAFWLLRKKRK